MKTLVLVAAAALAIGGAAPSFATSSGTFSVTCGSAPAGSDVPCSITRTSGGKGIYVLVQTADGTAKVGVDYMPVKELLYFKASQISATVPVHTVVDAAAAGQTQTFIMAVAASSVAATATGSIVQPGAPPPPPVICPDGTTVPAGQTCPTPPPPTTTWVSAPITEGGYVRCKRVGGCISDSYPCPQGLNPPAVCGEPDIVAQQGDVFIYRWGGKMDDSFVWEGIIGPTIGDFWPIGHDPKATGVASDWYLGFEAPITLNDWEGVTPAQ